MFPLLLKQRPTESSTIKQILNELEFNVFFRYSGKESTDSKQVFEDKKRQQQERYFSFHNNRLFTSVNYVIVNYDSNTYHSDNGGASGGDDWGNGDENNQDVAKDDQYGAWDDWAGKKEDENAEQQNEDNNWEDNQDDKENDNDQANGGDWDGGWERDLAESCLLLKMISKCGLSQLLHKNGAHFFCAVIG